MMHKAGCSHRVVKPFKAHFGLSPQMSTCDEQAYSVRYTQNRVAERLLCVEFRVNCHPQARPVSCQGGSPDALAPKCKQPVCRAVSATGGVVWQGNHPAARSHILAGLRRRPAALPPATGYRYRLPGCLTPSRTGLHGRATVAFHYLSSDRRLDDRSVRDFLVNESDPAIRLFGLYPDKTCNHWSGLLSGRSVWSEGTATAAPSPFRNSARRYLGWSAAEIPWLHLNLLHVQERRPGPARPKRSDRHRPAVYQQCCAVYI